MKQTRKRSIVITGFLALLLLIAGTFAWTSISQRALNEKDGENKITSGGRIHDDYSKATGNKDIYGENFGTKDLYVRIKLSEYFEKNGSSLVAGTTKDDKNTWTPYGQPASEATTAYRDYVTWELGGDKIFLPTFNTDSTNKSTDAAKDAIDVLTGGATAQGNGEHDAFMDGQVVPNDDDATITHIAKPTLTQGRAPISMATWKTLPASEKIGAYWVIDTDGWAYWADTLKPTQATSLLLTQLSYNDEKIGGIEGKWYYGIDVIGEFATEEDKGDFVKSDHGAPSTDATNLINGLTNTARPEVEIGAIGEEFDFFGETYINLKDLGDGNYLVLRKNNIGHFTSEVDYNTSELKTAMDKYYNDLEPEAKDVVQPIQKTFTLGMGGTILGDGLNVSLTGDAEKDFATVDQVTGVKSAFALSAAEVNDVSGPGKAFPTIESRFINNTSWRLRTPASSSNSFGILMEVDSRGKLAANFPLSNQYAGIPALIIHP